MFTVTHHTHKQKHTHKEQDTHTNNNTHTNNKTHRHRAHIPLKTHSPGQVIPLITSPPGPPSESLQSDRDLEKSQEKYGKQANFSTQHGRSLWLSQKTSTADNYHLSVFVDQLKTINRDRLSPTIRSPSARQHQCPLLATVSLLLSLPLVIDLSLFSLFRFRQLFLSTWPALLNLSESVVSLFF